MYSTYPTCTNSVLWIKNQPQSWLCFTHTDLRSYPCIHFRVHRSHFPFESSQMWCKDQLPAPDCLLGHCPINGKNSQSSRNLFTFERLMNMSVIFIVEEIFVTRHQWNSRADISRYLWLRVLADSSDKNGNSLHNRRACFGCRSQLTPPWSASTKRIRLGFPAFKLKFAYQWYLPAKPDNFPCVDESSREPVLLEAPVHTAYWPSLHTRGPWMTRPWTRFPQQAETWYRSDEVLFVEWEIWRGVLVAFFWAVIDCSTYLRNALLGIDSVTCAWESTVAYTSLATPVLRSFGFLLFGLSSKRMSS